MTAVAAAWRLVDGWVGTRNDVNTAAVESVMLFSCGVRSASYIQLPTLKYTTLLLHLELSRIDSFKLPLRRTASSHPVE